MSTRVFTESQAISIAVGFLDEMLPKGSPPSHISARHVCRDELVARQKQLEEFVAQNGHSDADGVAFLVKQLGPTEAHWSVQFFAIEEPGTASTTPPTIVRVYDADGHAELAE